jgi:hypothetical protein
MSRLCWRWWPRHKTKSSDDAKLASDRFEGGDRRHLLQALSAFVGGDCIVQNGTRHRWRNPLPEPCLMAFISLGGRRG